MTRRIPYDASQFHPDTNQSIQLLHRQLLEFRFDTLGPDFRTAIVAIAELLGQQSAGGSEKVSGGDISDGTFARMQGRWPQVTALDEMVAEGVEAFAHLNLFARRIAAVTRVARAPEMAAVRDANRCFAKPEFHTAAWYRADCVELIVHPDTKWGGLCSPCYQRAYRWEKASAA